MQGAKMDKIDDTLISVVIPVYNAEQYISAALDSVAAQTYRPLEIIIIDDGSTDESARRIAAAQARLALPIRTLFQENRGPAAARNQGLAVAQGEFIAFQDADDLWAMERLSLQRNILQSNPAASAVIGRAQFFYDPVTTTPTPEQLDAPTWFFGMHSGLYRRAAFEQVGNFNETLRYYEDIDWFRRAQTAGVTILAHNGVVLYHRRHAHNMTNDKVPLRRDLLRMLRQSPRPASSESSLVHWITSTPVH